MAGKKGRILILSLLLTGIACFPSEAGSWQMLPDGGYICRGDAGMPLTGWFEDGGKWYYGGENGVILMNAVTPDGYYVDSTGAWYRRSAKLLGIDFQAPERYMAPMGENVSWTGQSSLEELSSVIEKAFGGTRHLKISGNGLEYKNSEGKVLMGLYPDGVYGGWRMDIAVNLDSASADLQSASAYTYQVFQAFLYQISSSPELGIWAISDGWSGTNAWGLNRTVWTRVGDMQILYGASEGMGHFWMIP